MERRLLDALVLTLGNFANFQSVRNKATVDAHLHVYITAILHSVLYQSVVLSYICICVGFCVARS